MKYRGLKERLIVAGISWLCSVLFILGKRPLCVLMWLGIYSEKKRKNEKGNKKKSLLREGIIVLRTPARNQNNTLQVLI